MGINPFDHLEELEKNNTRHIVGHSLDNIKHHPFVQETSKGNTFETPVIMKNAEKFKYNKKPEEIANLTEFCGLATVAFFFSMLHNLMGNFEAFYWYINTI